MLSLLLTQPVLLNSVVIGSGGPFSQDVLHRAIISRTRTSHRPALLHSTSIFPCSRYSAPSAKPCPTAILWSRVSHKALEICVEGRRQGATKKCADSGRLMICKLEFMKTFLSLADDKYMGMSYKDIKGSADQYKAVWTQTRFTLGVWTAKPTHLEDFTVN